MFAARGNWHEALVHYRLAEHWLLTNRPELEEDDFGASIKEGLVLSEAHAGENRLVADRFVH